MMETDSFYCRVCSLYLGYQPWGGKMEELHPITVSAVVSNLDMKMIQFQE